MTTATKKNEIATVSKDRFMSLRDDSDYAEAVAANIAAGEKIDESVLTRVPTPTAGGTTWTIAGPAGEEQTKAIEGVLVYHCRRGVLWPQRQPKPGSMPVLLSHDLETAEQFGPIPKDMIEHLNRYRIDDRHYRWKDVYQIFGGMQEQDDMKRAKEQRVLFILREQEPWPLIVTAQPGSLKTVKPFVIKLQVPHYRAVVSLGLEKVTNSTGQPYSRIVPKLVGTLSVDDGWKVKATYTDVLAKSAKDILADLEDSAGDEE